jgi:hypothetical protein
MPRQPAAELTITQPQRDITAATTTDEWSEWLQRQLAPLHTALGQLLAEERRKLDRKTAEFELKLAKLTGAVDVLRGAAPPPPPKFPSIQAWSADAAIYYEREIVTFNGSTYQAIKDTARAPDTSDWVCLAAAGAGFTIRGTYDSAEEYKRFDIVIINGSSFTALKDNPGSCPDSGDWHLLASRGSRGQRGAEGARGITGLRGERGTSAPTIQSWLIDRTRYTATPMMSDGSIGSTLELRALFEQFLLETTNSKG